MSIEISGHHVEVTDAIRTAVLSKFSKVSSHYPDLGAMKAIITVEKLEQKIDVTAHYLGDRVAIHASNNDMYRAIADGAKKLDKVLQHRKGNIKNVSHEKITFEVEAETEVETEYHEED